MNDMVYHRPTGLAYSPSTLIMIEGAPGFLTSAATYGGRTVAGTYVPHDPSSQTRAPSRHILDVSSFSSPDPAAHPIVTVTLRDAVSTWTWVGEAANGMGFVVPFTVFTKSTPWTMSEKTIAVGAAVAVLGGIAWWWKQKQP